MRKTLLAALLGMAGCAAQSTGTPPPISYAHQLTSAEVDRSCVLAASDKLARRGLTAVDGRAIAVPEGTPMPRDISDGRQVELDVQNAGLTQTYVYACAVAPNGSFASLVGIR
jgi:hypothetical protein